MHQRVKEPVGIAEIQLGFFFSFWGGFCCCFLSAFALYALLLSSCPIALCDRTNLKLLGLLNQLVCLLARSTLLRFWLVPVHVPVHFLVYRLPCPLFPLPWPCFPATCALPNSKLKLKVCPAASALHWFCYSCKIWAWIRHTHRHTHTDTHTRRQSDLPLYTYQHSVAQWD